MAARLIGDPLALEVTARAGRAALAEGALAAAVSHLGHAIELAAGDVPAQLLVDYAAALSATARVQEAREVCTELLARDDLEAEERARVLTMMARGAMAAGRPDEAEGLYEDAAEAAAAAGAAVEAATLAEAALGGQAALPSSWVLDKVVRALAVLPEGDPKQKAARAAAGICGFDGGRSSRSRTRWGPRSGGGSSAAARMKGGRGRSPCIRSMPASCSSS